MELLIAKVSDALLLNADNADSLGIVPFEACLLCLELTFGGLSGQQLRLMLVLDVPFCYVEALGDDGASAVASLGVLANPVGRSSLMVFFK